MLSPSRRREIMHHWNNWMSFVPAIGDRLFQLTNNCPVTSEPFIKLTNHSYKSHTVIWSWNTDKVIKKHTSKICAANATTDETNLGLVRFHRLSWPRAQVVHFSITTKRVSDVFWYSVHVQLYCVYAACWFEFDRRLSRITTDVCKNYYLRQVQVIWFRFFMECNYSSICMVHTGVTIVHLNVFSRKFA